VGSSLFKKELDKMGYLKLVLYTLVVYGCAYGIVNRICNCIEKCIQAKFDSSNDDV